MILATHGILASGGGGIALDVDVEAFLTATGITDNTQKQALNTFVTTVKTCGVWAKMKAIYPFIGGSAFTHKFNLKDPRDLDVAYRLQFINGWTHSSTGALPNGVDAYADTKLVPLSVFTNLNDVGVSNYQVNSFSGYQEGCYDSVGRFLYGASTTNIDVRLNADTSTPFTVGYSSDGKGLFTVTKQSSTLLELYRNGSLATSVNRGTSSVNASVMMGARNNSGTPNGFFSVEKRFTAFHTGLTSSEASCFYSAVNAMQVTLGRNV